MKKITLLLFFLSVFLNVKATHLMGGEITWECIKTGPKAGFYVFQVKVYRDCQGIAIDTTMSLDVHNVPGMTTIPLTWISGTDISPTCNTIDGPNPQFSCNGFNQGMSTTDPGAVEEHIYRSDTIRILGTPDANGWHFTWTSCCRNNAITNISNPGTYGFTLRAVMYSYTDSTGTVFPNTNLCYDSSPKFYEKPRTILEVGNGPDTLAFSNGFTYSHNAFDEEMDSINYSWGRPLDGSNPPSYNFLTPNSIAVPFVAPYSFSNPINNINMNPTTGRTWYPANNIGNYVTCTKVSAYKCGQLVSEIFREIQIVIIPPTCNLGDTTNGNIGADTLCNVRPLVQPPFFYPASTSPYQWDTLVHCGDTVSFDFIANDYDFYPNGSQQDLKFEVSGGQFYDYNNNTLCQNPPCATFQEIGTGATPPFITSGGTGVGHFEWITSCNHVVNTCGSTLRPSVYTFVIKVSDDFCPAPAIENTTQVISITVYPPCGGNVKTNLSTTNATCILNDGTAQVSPSGGIPPYTVYWTDINGMTVNPNTLSYGDYIVRVTDSTSCSAVDTFTIFGPVNVLISTQQSNVSCNSGNDGSINLTVIPDSSLVFSWSNGENTKDVDSLIAGVYFVNITDTFGCVTTQSFTITEPSLLTGSITAQTNVSCNGGNNGSITITASGGSPNYTYDIGSGPQFSGIFSSLIAGNYTITITDSNICSTSVSVTITEPTAIVNSMISSSVSCFGASDGSVTSTQSGGSPPYSYLWSSGDTTQSILSVSGGTYTLTITDANSCMLIDSISVIEPTILQPTVIDTSGTLTGISIGGTLPYTYEFWGPNGFVASSVNNFGNSFSITPNVSGMYTFIVIDANNCTDSVSIPFSTNFSPTVSVSLSNTWCDSLTTLTIQVSQDSGEVDMSTALFQSNAGSFDIASMNVGDTIGTASMMANGGGININTFLIVSALISVNQAIIQSCSNVNGCLGSFAITNSTGGGIEILAQTIPDSNNYTAGNMSTAIFDNVFINPCIPLTFTSTINSELGDVYIDSVTFIISGLNQLEQTKFVIYPNPTSRDLSLQFKDIKREVIISITDIVGKDIFSDRLYRNTNRINLSLENLQKGSYILIVETDGNRYSQVIIYQ